MRHHKSKKVSDSSSVLNTHTYDGQIKEMYVLLKNLDQHYLINTLSYEQCLSEISQSASGGPELTSLINQIKSSSYENYDATNAIHFVDILPKVWRFYRNSSDQNLFFEQFLDISTGSCAQGRTIRMFQLYNIWMDAFKKYLMNPEIIDENQKLFIGLLKEDLSQIH